MNTRNEDGENMPELTEPGTPISELDQIIMEKLGETSGLFMSKETKGTEIVMPTEELTVIGLAVKAETKELLIRLIDGSSDLSELKAQVTAL